MPEAAKSMVPEWWTDVPSYSGVYQVSHLGRVRCIATGKGRRRPPHVLTAQPNRHGYLYVCLMEGGYRDVRAVHDLVAAAFLGPKPTGTEVDHKNFLKEDNRASNLQYLTPSQNSERWARIKSEVYRGYRDRQRM